MKPSHLYVLLILIIIVMFSCSKNPDMPDFSETDSEYSGDVLMPAKTGNYWQYRLWTYFHTSYDTVTYSITSRLSIVHEDTTYNCFTARWDNITSDANWVYCNQKDGLYRMGGYDADDTLIEPVLEFKYPVDEGETWQVPRMVYHPLAKFYIKDTLTYTCIDTNFTYITPLDTFNTIVYMFRLSQGDDVSALEVHYNYFCPEIGLVGNQRNSEDEYFNYKRKTGEFKIITYCLH